MYNCVCLTRFSVAGKTFTGTPSDRTLRDMAGAGGAHNYNMIINEKIKKYMTIQYAAAVRTYEGWLRRSIAAGTHHNINNIQYSTHAHYTIIIIIIVV